MRKFFPQTTGFFHFLRNPNPTDKEKKVVSDAHDKYVRSIITTKYPVWILGLILEVVLRDSKLFVSPKISLIFKDSTRLNVWISRKIKPKMIGIDGMAYWSVRRPVYLVKGRFGRYWLMDATEIDRKRFYKRIKLLPLTITIEPVEGTLTYTTYLTSVKILNI